MPGCFQLESVSETVGKFSDVRPPKWRDVKFAPQLNDVTLCQGTRAIEISGKGQVQGEQNKLHA